MMIKIISETLLSNCVFVLCVCVFTVNSYQVRKKPM